MNWLKRMIFPNRCLGCSDIVSQDDHTFCPACWANIDMIQPPWCNSCGIPLEFSYTEDASLSLCARCDHTKPFYDYARSAYVYNDASKKGILALKHQDQTHYSRTYASILYKMYPNICNECEVIVPIPLHWKRLMMRQYNQAGLIAKHLGRLCNKPVDFDHLKRTVATKSQGHQGRAERIKNLDNAFIVAGDDAFYQKKILVIDDVMTTGATLNQAAWALRTAKPKQIVCLTIAHALPHGGAKQE
ncbi:MAG: ComF family protein [Alphaproteobacteria bacterium]|nr:ComF family protein [Alphaproteobacteria bacterium]